MDNRNWQQSEIAILRSIVESGASLKKSMHLLPGRTYAAADYKRRHMAGSSTPALRRIKELMSDGKPRTAREISTELEISRKSVDHHMRASILETPERWAHIVTVATKYSARVYKIGNEPDECAIDLDRDLTDEQLDAKYRFKGAWYRDVDPVVVESMRAMCSVGSAHS